MFLAENSTDDVATGWIERYNQNNAEAMCELINFVLKCSGCDLKVDVQDIEDPDNAASRLADLQDEFQAQKISDYPLAARVKSNFSRATMVDFFTSFVEAAHASELFYSDNDLYENIQIWVSGMSTSSSRPFRHTATVISLSIATAICGVIKEIVSTSAAALRQKEGEEKKKSVNRGRVATLKAKVEEQESKKEAAEAWLKDIYDTVFVHRYRDVDSKIRVDCAHAMGVWILACPDIFFDGTSLRYLGWLLSDTVATVRSEVVKQLLRLYKSKDSVGRLRAFTDRFRERMVEMATQDADISIRASMIELLDLIREMGLLEPDDIDTVGRMIFDTDPKVRRAVAGFFAENINDFLESAIEEIGGEEILNETLGDEAEDDFDNPRQAWLKLKCLSEVLESYDTENSREGTPDIGGLSLVDTGVDTRYSVAAGVVCDGVEEAREWEVISGYLLYDNSTTAHSRTNDDPMEAFKKRCLLSEKEERLLLEVLIAAVKYRLSEAVEAEKDKNKKQKVRKDEARTIQENTALHLASIIPRLLRKFGARPATASPVLRLGLLLDLEIFQELRQDSTEFASLLDDINRQFLSHADHGVLQDARDALLYARGFEDLEEVTETKLQELWDGTVTTLRQLIKAKTPQMTSLANTAHRIANLASISDCSEAFEQEPRASTNSRSHAPTKVLDILLDLIRGYSDVVDPDANSLVTNAMSAVQFYFMWQVQSIKTRAEAGEKVDSTPSTDDCIAALVGCADGRPKLDDVRLSALGHILDTYSLFATLRNTDSKDAATARILTNLAQEASSKAQQLALSSFAAAEKVFAKKARRALEATDEDLEQEPESELEDSSEEEEEGDEEDQARRAQHKQQEQLMAEKRLCELTGKLVMAIIARVIDASGPTKGSLRKRIMRNKTKLGSNFKEVLAYLEDPKPKRGQKGKAKPAEAEPVKEKPAAKSAEIVAEDEEDEIEDVEEEPSAGNDDEESAAEESEPEREEVVNDDIEDSVMGD